MKLAALVDPPAVLPGYYPQSFHIIRLERSWEVRSNITEFWHERNGLGRSIIRRGFDTT